MSTEKTVRQFAEEWNAEIEAKGMLLREDPWSMPALYEGPLLDLPVTPEARKRIERLHQLAAELKREKAEQAAKAIAEHAAGVAQEVRSQLSENEPSLSQ